MALSLSLIYIGGVDRGQRDKISNIFIGYANRGLGVEIGFKSSFD